MIERIAPQFFTTNIPDTLAYYADKLGFACPEPYADPPFYAIVVREDHTMHFRLVDSLIVHPGKYDEEYLDAYITVSDADALYREYRDRGVAFHRELGTTPWNAREFVVRDCDGRLLCFGAPVDS